MKYGASTSVTLQIDPFETYHNYDYHFSNGNLGQDSCQHHVPPTQVRSRRLNFRGLKGSIMQGAKMEILGTYLLSQDK